MDDLSNLIDGLSDEQLAKVVDMISALDEYGRLKLAKVVDMISALDEYGRLKVLGSMTDEELEVLVEFQKSAIYKMKSGEANG